MPRTSKKELAARARARARGLSNEELLHEVIVLAGGDEPDGGFSDAGAVEFATFRQELEERLAGWLAEPAPAPAGAGG